MNKLHLSRALRILSASALLLLAACGGGGDDDDGGTPATNGPIRPTTTLGSSFQYEGICDLETQKKFTRSYLDEVYFWYDEIVDVDPARFNNIPDYFEALLVRTPDANGVPKDRFSAVLPEGLVRQPAPASAALLSLDPGLLADHTTFVPVTKVVTSPGGRRAGYIQFNDHDLGAQDDLIAAFRQIKAAGVQDLVLDLRFNSGGFLYIADTAASMITGPSAEGKVFERLQFNDKRPQETADSTFRFSSRVQVADVTEQGVNQNRVGTLLPQLDLPRVFILTSGRTCSASESIINSLRGIDVQVIRIGDTTCGKPYGFRQKNNCGLAFFPIEFKGTNAKGFGDYTTGIQPTCQVQDNPNVAADDPADPLLSGALTFMDTGACPAGTATGITVQQGARPRLNPAAQPTRPSWAGRLLLPSQQR
ncbi:MAG TPA: S41 family peptidase [Ramlibacter sp.]|uniref:S41 family peptidase n=1 Tax=Ramlibacter sp. TaxID=1917967 RepID=UPI002D7E6745|nr:S41 family peptidase [Ramlibacter sp.]HET8747534.1 S41 family peptidase [Ramlibacter sp.]